MKLWTADCCCSAMNQELNSETALVGNLYQPVRSLVFWHLAYQIMVSVFVVKQMSALCLSKFSISLNSYVEQYSEFDHAGWHSAGR